MYLQITKNDAYCLHSAIQSLIEEGYNENYVCPKIRLYYRMCEVLNIKKNPLKQEYVKKTNALIEKERKMSNIVILNKTKEKMPEIILSAEIENLLKNSTDAELRTAIINMKWTIMLLQLRNEELQKAIDNVDEQIKKLKGIR
jgi:hypothetical protein